jgi:hypothetical protein
MKRKRPGRFRTIVIVVGCVLLSPIIVPYFLIGNAFADRRRKRDAENFRCAQCGSFLGRASIAKADEYWREHVRELHKRFPGSRFRLVRKVWAICTECGARYNYRTKDRTYVLQSDEEENTAVVDG